MHPRINVVTLATGDLERAVKFYRDGLGWETDGIVGTEFEHGAVAFFPLQNGLLLAIYPQEHLAATSGLRGADHNPLELSLGCNVNSARDVDIATDAVRRAGGDVVKAPFHTNWGGYMSYFRDPDGHLWEIVYNPALRVDD